MVYRLAHSLEKLRSQVNAMAPNRSKVSDGWIGDSAHFATGSASDHNPWVKLGSTGIVTAFDITHDPAHGCDVMAIANSIAKSRDRRLKYMIYTGGVGGKPGILSSTISPWTWRTRANDDHPHHLHISVDSNVADFDSVIPWSIGTTITEEDVALTEKEKQEIATLVVHDLLLARLGRSDTNVGQALQGITGLHNTAPIDVTALAKALVAAWPVGATSITPEDAKVIAKASADEFYRRQQS